MSQKLIDLLDETIGYIQGEIRNQHSHWTDTYLTSDTFEQWVERWCKEETKLIESLRIEKKILEDKLEQE